MTEEQEQELEIKQIAALAKQSDSTLKIDWSQLEITEDQAFIMMASNVIEQLESVPDEHILSVCQATMTKLLVENFALNLKIKGMNNDEI